MLTKQQKRFAPFVDLRSDAGFEACWPTATTRTSSSAC